MPSIEPHYLETTGLTITFLLKKIMVVCSISVYQTTFCQYWLFCSVQYYFLVQIEKNLIRFLIKPLNNNYCWFPLQNHMDHNIRPKDTCHNKTRFRLSFFIQTNSFWVLDKCHKRTQYLFLGYVNCSFHCIGVIDG